MIIDDDDKDDNGDRMIFMLKRNTTKLRGAKKAKTRGTPNTTHYIFLKCFRKLIFN